MPVARLSLALVLYTDFGLVSLADWSASSAPAFTALTNKFEQQELQRL